MFCMEFGFVIIVQGFYLKNCIVYMRKCGLHCIQDWSSALDFWIEEMLSKNTCHGFVALLCDDGFRVVGRRGNMGICGG